MTPPADPIAAVTHPDPYPYYRALARERPFHRDEKPGVWVAAGAAAVRAALHEPALRVRPPEEPVPRALLGGAAGALFARLVRMNDGDRPLRRAVRTALGGVDAGLLSLLARERARALLTARNAAADHAQIAPFAFDLAAGVVASLLGVPERHVDEASALTGALVAAFSLLASPADVSCGNEAAPRLVELAREASGGLADALRREAERCGVADGDAVDANTVGLLVQSYEATAGLVGASLVAAGTPCAAAPETAAEVVRRAALLDPPVQNTRRWAALPCRLLGEEIRTGEMVLVLLASASPDPESSAPPGFGSGPHACPGDRIAMAIAEAGLAALLDSGVDTASAAATRRYRPSANTRVPIFGSGAMMPS